MREPTPLRRAGSRRHLGLVGLLLAALMALTACTPQQNAVLDAVNTTRSANGLPALLPSPDAMVKAQAWAERLASGAASCGEDGVLYHSELASGMRAGWRKLGENVGCGPDERAVHDGFLDSPGHRANILDPSFNWAGTGRAVAANGAVFVVHVFARY